MFAQYSVHVGGLWGFFLDQALNCVNLAVWLLYLQEKCAIYGSQMVPGFSVELQCLGFVFFYYYFLLFLFPVSSSGH